MRLQEDRALRDPEVVGLLADDPALLAIVDALQCTQPKRRRRRLPAKPVFASAAVAAAVAIALVAPWQTNPGLVSRALAAVGQQPVVHVVTAQTSKGISIFDLQTGRLTPASDRVEVFFDAGRRLERTISSSPLGGTADELHTAKGDWVNGTPVWTCALIAAHPAAAAKARVSCPAGASTQPRPPTLDPALADFATGYRAALTSHEARHVGDGTVNGRRVHWLAVGASERVAVDAQTLLPILVRSDERGHVLTYDVLEFETEPFAAADFVRASAPASPPAAGQSVYQRRAVTLAVANQALGGTLLEPPPLPGLRFEGARVVHLLSGYAGKRPARRTVAVDLSYRYHGNQLVVHESRQPDLIAGFTSGVTPAAGKAVVSYVSGLGRLSALERSRLADSPLDVAPWRAMLTKGGLYVTINSWSKQLLLRVAPALRRRR